MTSKSRRGGAENGDTGIHSDTDVDRMTQAIESVDFPSGIEYQTFSGEREGLETGDQDVRTRVTVVKAVKLIQSDPQLSDACLVLLYPPGPDLGKRFPLIRRELVLGRSNDCDLQIERDSVSRKHARIFYYGKEWRVEDLKSTNGSYVNDEAITKVSLRNGDLLKIGAAIFKFLTGSGIEASYHEEIYKLTVMDSLTGAHNKRYLLEFLQRETVRCGRYGRPLSLIMFDLDYLKQVNDNHGNLTGDHVLRELSRRLLARVSPEQLLARYGGAEFAVVLPEHDLTRALTFGEQIRQRVADQPFAFDGVIISITISVGVACIEGVGIEASEFIKIAKDNLFRAKREGRNRVVAGTRQWKRWKADPTFQSQASGKAAVVALSILARDQILASPGGVAHVDDLEGLLYSRLREHQKTDQVLSFGALEGGSKLLIAAEGRHAMPGLRALVFEALRRCAEERPEAQFAVGPVTLAKDGAKTIKDAVAGLDEEIGILEHGHYLPQPIAVAMRALDGMTTSRAKFVLELGETLLQWLALCTAAELGMADRTRTAALLHRHLGAGAGVQRWYEVLSVGIDEILGSGAVHNAAWQACFGDKSTRAHILACLKIAVDLKHAFSHGATASDEHVARRIIDEAAPRLCQLVKRELRPVLALVPAEVELVGFEGELQSYRITRIIGDGLAASAPMYSRRRMNPGLWLCDPIADRALPLEPFFVRDTCPKCGAREIFLLARLDELEFRNPASGHVLKKAIEGMPFSAEARELLSELTDVSSTGEPASHLRTDERPSTNPDLDPSPTGAPVKQHTSPAEAREQPSGLTGPSSPGEQTSQSLETSRHLTLQLRARRDSSAPEGQRSTHPGADPSPPRTVVKKHTILFLAANPSGTDRLALDREARAIQAELERSGFRDCFELMTRWAVEPLDLLRELRKLRPTVLHFSGYGGLGATGGQEHGLYLQGPDGQIQLVSTAALKETFGAAGASVKLVVLNACYSEMQASALIEHIDCVVGIGGSIRDDVARSFAIGFYGGLGERESVAMAYKQGCAAISLEGLSDADRPKLKVRAGIDAARLILAGEMRS